MIEKEDWLHRHPKASEKDWVEFVHYCCNRGFKYSNKSEKEVIFAPACGLSEDFLRKRDEDSERSSQLP